MLIIIIITRWNHSPSGLAGGEIYYFCPCSFRLGRNLRDSLRQNPDDTKVKCPGPHFTCLQCRNVMRYGEIKIEIDFCHPCKQDKISIKEMAETNTLLFSDEKLRNLMGETSRHISSQLVAAGLTVDMVPLAISVAIAIIAIAIFLLCKFVIWFDIPIYTCIISSNRSSLHYHVPHVHRSRRPLF